jgi:hypothetical protein
MTHEVHHSVCSTFPTFLGSVTVILFHKIVRCLTFVSCRQQNDDNTIIRICAFFFHMSRCMSERTDLWPHDVQLHTQVTVMTGKVHSAGFVSSCKQSSISAAGCLQHFARRGDATAMWIKFARRPQESYFCCQGNILLRNFWASWHINIVTTFSPTIK